MKIEGALLFIYKFINNLIEFIEPQVVCVAFVKNLFSEI